MKLRNCMECGKLMPMGLRNICSACAGRRETDYLKVREFVKDHQKVSIEVVSEATGVPEARVRQFLREGLIESADLDGSPLTCQRCGKPISRGVYCPLCQLEFGHGKTGAKDDIKHEDLKEKKRISLISEFRRRRKRNPI